MSNKPNPKRRPRTTAQTAKRPWWQSPLVWVAALVILAGVVAIAVTEGGNSAGDSGDETAFAEIIGTPLPPLAEPDSAIGMTAPVMSAQTLDGERVQVGDDGVPRLYGFFAHWCPHCQAELPRTVAWLESNELPDGVELVAVSTAVDPLQDNYPPSAWFEREGWPTTVLLDDEDGSLATGMGLNGFPYWVAVDSEGTVVARTSGELTEEQFEELLAPLAVGDPVG